MTEQTPLVFPREIAEVPLPGKELVCEVTTCQSPDDPILQTDRVFWIERAGDLAGSIGITAVKLDIDPSSRIAWGSPLKEAKFWDALGAAVLQRLSSIKGQGESTISEPPAPLDSFKPELKPSSNIPGLFKVDLSSEDIALLQWGTKLGASSINSELAVVAEATGRALAAINHLGGNKGVKLYTTPLFPTAIIAQPKDLGEFAKNIAETAVNPKKIIALASLVGGSALELDDEGKIDPLATALRLTSPVPGLDPKKYWNSLKKRLKDPGSIDDAVLAELKRTGKHIEDGAEDIIHNAGDLAEKAVDKGKELVKKIKPPWKW